MVRAGFVALGFVVASTSGCSLLLDFDSVGDDQVDELPYTQEECDYKEPNNSVAEAAMIEAGNSGPAAICAGDTADRDFYRFTVPATAVNVTVSVQFMNRPTGDLDLRITDASGATTLGQSRGFDDGELVTCPGASPVCPKLNAGDYIFEVFPATPGAINRYEISLLITQ
jgi:Bacterial pre-peptidase C-terminal domain